MTKQKIELDKKVKSKQSKLAFNQLNDSNKHILSKVINELTKRNEDINKLLSKNA